LVERQPAFGETPFQRCSKRKRLAFAPAVADDIVSVPFKWHTGKSPLQPDVERVMQEQIGQQRRDYALNAKDNFRFERTIIGWRGRVVLDLRHKR
jgi:chorismate mutase